MREALAAQGAEAVEALAALEEAEAAMARAVVAAGRGPCVLALLLEAMAEGDPLNWPVLPQEARVSVLRLLSGQPLAEGGEARRLSQGERETVRALARGPLWDGDLPSKAARDELERRGLVGRWEGWNFLAPSGVRLASSLGLLREEA